MINNKLRKKTAEKYIINWIGGKRLLRKTIAKLIPEDIGSYIEPFCGAAWVLFYKEKWANLEVINDLNYDLVNMFNVIKYHPDEFTKELKWMYNSRSVFVQQTELKPVTDIQRAVKFFYLINRSYGAKGNSFATARNGKTSSGKSHLNILDRVWAASSRFDKVYIENLDFEELISKYDCDSAFFYVDPPYVEGADYYEVVNKKFDHERLKKCLDKVKGRWLLSYGDNSYIRKIYKNYEIIEVSRHNTMNSTVKSTFKELLIKNY